MNQIGPFPYFSQFASRELVNAFLARQSATGGDPRWHEAGWASRREYAFWAWQTCGVACLRSILAANGHRPTPARLTQDLIDCGAYMLDQERRTVDGLIYAPFVEYVLSEWDINSEVRPELTVDELRAEMEKRSRTAIVSVHPTIRDAGTSKGPAGRLGGHLILVHSMSPDGIRFHNPSGYWPYAQSDVRLPWAEFDKFYANRGIIIRI